LTPSLSGILLLAWLPLASPIVAQDEEPPSPDELEQKFDRLGTDLPADELVRIASEFDALLESEECEVGDEAFLRLGVGFAFLRAERFEKALEHLKVSGELARAKQDLDGALRAFGNAGVAAFQLGRLDAAARLTDEAIDAANELGQETEVWRLLNTLGGVHVLRADYRAALSTFERALELGDAVGDRSAEATIVYNVGLAHLYLQQYREAEAFFERSLQIRIELDDPGGIAEARAGLGDCRRMQGELDEALRLHRLALEGRERAGGRDRVAVSLRSLGAVLHDRGDSDAAVEHLERAVAIQRELGQAAEVAATLAELSRVLGDLDRADEALDAATEGSALAEELTLQGFRVTTLLSLAEAYEEAGDHEAALAAYKEGTELYEQQRTAEVEQAIVALQDDLRERDHRLQLAQERQLLIFSVALGLGALVWALLAWRSNRAGARARAELSQLNADLSAANRDLERRGAELARALEEIDRLEGLLPICSHCKSIRDEHGRWAPLEEYFESRSEVGFSHGICPDCLERHYPDHRPARA